ncbi:hypothetical protein COCON_G00154780 [Conger conger]|uniref:Uncharacterized protein n=1 Tax=Conger conger TaxID=82655 RepID=A0A9Q1HUV2_CONCO|nr:hypothetical protein COCON_G00154780 [Conger conger]
MLKASVCGLHVAFFIILGSLRRAPAQALACLASLSCDISPQSIATRSLPSSPRLRGPHWTICQAQGALKIAGSAARGPVPLWAKGGLGESLHLKVIRMHVHSQRYCDSGGMFWFFKDQIPQMYPESTEMYSLQMSVSQAKKKKKKKRSKIYCIGHCPSDKHLYFFTHVLYLYFESAEITLCGEDLSLQSGPVQQTEKHSCVCLTQNTYLLL